MASLEAETNIPADRSPVPSLSGERMHLFTLGLAGLPPEEIRKAKRLHMRNAIAEYHAFREQAKGSGCLFAMFAIIPIFWPFLYFGLRSMSIQTRLARERIQNALDVWADDLEGEVYELDGQPIRPRRAGSQ